MKEYSSLNSFRLYHTKLYIKFHFYFHQISDLKCTIADLEKERDFYFGKLRNIELICQEKEGEADPTLKKIVDILYATDVSVKY